MLPNSWTQQDKQLLLSDVLVYLPAQHVTRRLSEVQSAESSVRQLPRDSCHEDPIKIKRKILWWHAPNTVKNADSVWKYLNKKSHLHISIISVPPSTISVPSTSSIAKKKKRPSTWSMICLSAVWGPLHGCNVSLQRMTWSHNQNQFISRFTPWKTNMLNPKMELWKMISFSIGWFFGSSRSFSGLCRSVPSSLLNRCLLYFF